MNEDRPVERPTSEDELAKEVAFANTPQPSESLGGKDNTPMPEQIDSAQDQMAGNAPLLPEEQTSRFQERWQAIQAQFVDEPKTSTKEADSLVAEVMQQL